MLQKLKRKREYSIRMSENNRKRQKVEEDSDSAETIWMKMWRVVSSWFTDKKQDKVNNSGVVVIENTDYEEDIVSEEPNHVVYLISVL